MTKSPLKDFVIRTAVARKLDLGFIYAADPKKEEKDIPHAITFKWKGGEFSRGECNFDAHTACVIEQPEFGIVVASGAGYYSVNTPKGTTTGDILRDSQPQPKERRIRGIRSVAEVARKAYAVGLSGMVYRLDQVSKWTRIDEGLPKTFDILEIHGFDGSNLYAVGRRGQLWHYNGKKWIQRELPTNKNLNAVKCVPGGTVYIAGYSGMLIRGSENRWSVIEHDETEEDLWDVEWFEGKLYAATMEAVYRLEGDVLEPVDFGKDAPDTCSQLSVAKDVMWSIGENDIMSFDGKKWTRIV